MGPCGPASAQRDRARRALALGWAPDWRRPPAPPAGARPGWGDPDGPRRPFASRQAPASLHLNLTWQCPGFWPVSRHPELLAEHSGRLLCTAAA